MRQVKKRPTSRSSNKPKKKVSASVAVPGLTLAEDHEMFLFLWAARHCLPTVLKEVGTKWLTPKQNQRIMRASGIARRMLTRMGQGKIALLLLAPLGVPAVGILAAVFAACLWELYSGLTTEA